MQMAAPELMDISKESPEIRQLYGLDEKSSEKFGRMCLMARRMVERGVRFVQLISTDWDGHSECDKNHLENKAYKIDKPVAGLLGDLKRRGLLENTLVISTGEFGRTPIVQGKNGRDHHPYGFSTRMAGGGIRGGKVIGATDELGSPRCGRQSSCPRFARDNAFSVGLDHSKTHLFLQGRESPSH
ncbi:MAG: DUF1501 domain-containing protein [Terriglobia bacterium]